MELQELIPQSQIRCSLTHAFGRPPQRDSTLLFHPHTFWVYRSDTDVEVYSYKLVSSLHVARLPRTPASKRSADPPAPAPGTQVPAVEKLFVYFKTFHTLAVVPLLPGDMALIVRTLSTMSAIAVPRLLPAFDFRIESILLPTDIAELSNVEPLTSGPSMAPLDQSFNPFATPSSSTASLLAGGAPSSPSSSSSSSLATSAGRPLSSLADWCGFGSGLGRPIIPLSAETSPSILSGEAWCAALLRRWGVSARSLEITSQNYDFSVCKSYPRSFITPGGLKCDLRTIASLCTGGRLPILAYFRPDRPMPTPGGGGHPAAAAAAATAAAATTTTTAGPTTGIAVYRSGMFLRNARCLTIDVFFRELGRALGTEDALSVIVDPRSPNNAGGFYANAATHGGPERNFHIFFAGLETSQGLRPVFARMLGALNGPDKGMAAFHTDILPWLTQVQNVLASVRRLSDFILTGSLGALLDTRIPSSGSALPATGGAAPGQRFLLVQDADDGSDLASLLVSLVKVIVDPHYRTLGGLRDLIDEDWCSFGFRFSDRCGQLPAAGQTDIYAVGAGSVPAAAPAASGGATDVHETLGAVPPSPILVLFVECLLRVMSELPRSFEYNELAVLSLFDAMHSCQFGNFILNNEFSRSRANATPSLQGLPSGGVGIGSLSSGSVGSFSAAGLHFASSHASPSARSVSIHSSEPALPVVDNELRVLEAVQTPSFWTYYRAPSSQRRFTNRFYSGKIHPGPLPVFPVSRDIGSILMGFYSPSWSRHAGGTIARLAGIRPLALASVGQPTVIRSDLRAHQDFSPGVDSRYSQLGARLQELRKQISELKAQQAATLDPPALEGDGAEVA
ncbi:hypothetical protein H696_05238 [Fonticula alba]|uniref:Myotubularin phosphatase domain-containing protein n=1 Tax=Fonticula alba TaxID=691883 RepID=A0A058Z2F7_FONAL|nr:hypothetical protein H696_05238 [Fonticula alba]KCV68321.1 hypothetical protein H696_05238 [Fonticula alba]|eukprot:XP_009497375.1 hypothetical protein H696_05238 [Fonticula alba]